MLRRSGKDIKIKLKMERMGGRNFHINLKICDQNLEERRRKIRKEERKRINLTTINNLYIGKCVCGKRQRSKSWKSQLVWNDIIAIINNSTKIHINS